MLHGLEANMSQNDRQWVNQLLRQSLGPAVVHLLRTTPPEYTKPEAERLDWLFFKFMLEVAYWDDGTRFWGNSEPRRRTPEAWQAFAANLGAEALKAKALMHLRIVQGGLGIPSAAATAEAAYAGSICLCAADIVRRGFLGPDFDSAAQGAIAFPSFATLVQKQKSLLETAKATTGVTATTVFNEAIVNAQRALTEASRASAYADALKMVEEDPQAAANFLSRAAPEAAGYLLASAAVKPNQIHNAEFSIMLRARMCLPQVPGIGGPGQPKHLFCTSTERTDPKVTAAGDHALLCVKGYKGMDARHDAIVENVAANVRRANRHSGSNFQIETEPELEGLGWQRRANGQQAAGPAEGDFRDKGRGDISIAKPNDPLNAKVIDVAVVHPSLYTHANANRVEGTAAAGRWRSKNSQYKMRWGQTAAGGRLIILVWETGGRMHPESFKWLKTFFAAMGEDGKAAFKAVLTQTSVQLQRHCARAIRALSLRQLAQEQGGQAAGGPPKAADLYAFVGPALAGAPEEG